MRRGVILWGGVLTVAAVASAAQRPSAQKIVAEYVRAMGGAKALGGIHASSVAGSVREEGSGASGSYTLLTASPNKFYMELIVEPERRIEAYNGKSAWAQDADGGGGDGAQTLRDRDAALAAALGRYWNGRLTNLKKDKLSVRYVGEENVASLDAPGRTVRAEHVEIALGPGVTRELYFDTTSHLLIRDAAGAEGGAEAGASGEARGEAASDFASEMDYGDYREVEGVEAPYRIEMVRCGRRYAIAVTRVEFNGAIAEETFNFPSQPTQPLPDIPELLLAINKNQATIEALQKQYTCRVSEEEEKTDGRGEITSRTVSDYDVFYIGGEEVRHLLAKNGKPLEGAEKAKEDERFNKEFDKLEKREAELAGDARKQQKEEAQDQEQVSDFLRAERFTNARRERFRGQDVIVFDFGPNPDYKPKNLAESIVQKLVGVVWVDEQARDVARLEAHFSDNVKIGAGLLGSVQKGSSVVFEQTRINNEVWMPSYAEVHAAARVLFIKAHENEIDRYSDYRKFHVDVKIGAAAAAAAAPPVPAAQPASESPTAKPRP